MKKGFANFNSSSFNLPNTQKNSNTSNNNNLLNNSDIPNQDKPATTERKQPQVNSFSTVNRQPEGFTTPSENHSNRAGYHDSNLPFNSGIFNGLRNNNMVPNAGFSNFPMFNVENPQYFPNSMPAFGDNPHAMLFSQFQNGSSLNNNQASSQAMLMTLFQIIQNQSKSLQSLYDKVEKMTVKINEFGQRMKQIKKAKKQPLPEEDVKPVIEHIGQSLQNIDSKTLIKILFGSNKVYNYKLELMESLELPLYRERNFSISLKLTDNEGKIVKNNNKIPLSLAIYSSQNPPKFIEKNTAGQKILKGYIEQSLHFGQCRFEKIQIKQVTSHFRNGWVFIVIIPCMTPLGSANPNDSFIDYLKIQPLVLEKVIVKAKKIKDTGKKGKQEKEESEMAEAKDSQNGMHSEKLESKQRNNGEKNKVKAEQKDEDCEAIFEEK